MHGVIYLTIRGTFVHWLADNQFFHCSHDRHGENEVTAEAYTIILSFYYLRNILSFY